MSREVKIAVGALIAPSGGSTLQKRLATPDDFQARFQKAFDGLRECGMTRSRICSTAHEYELFYSGSQKAVRITLERQWAFQYVFVLFYKKNPHGEWEPVGYLDKLLLERGWSQTAVEALLDAKAPVMNLSLERQEAFLGKIAEVVCSLIKGDLCFTT